MARVSVLVGASSGVALLLFGAFYVAAKYVAGEEYAQAGEEVGEDHTLCQVWPVVSSW